MTMFYLYSLMNIQEVGHTMRELAREMERAGLIDEIMDDTFATMEVCKVFSYLSR